MMNIIAQDTIIHFVIGSPPAPVRRAHKGERIDVT